MRISLDFDGVLSHTMKSWVLKYNEKYGANITTRAVERWSFFEDFGLGVKDAFVIFEEAWSDIQKLEPLEQDIWQKTKMLSNIGQLDVVTNVNVNMAANIKKWLDKYGVVRNKLVFSEKKWELDYDVFIDDSPDNILKIIKNGKIALVYNQPWNRHIDDQGVYEGSGLVYRVYNLYHAIDMIKSLREANVLC